MENNDSSQRNGLKKTYLIFGISMTLVFIALGASILLKSDFFPRLPLEYRSMFAWVLIVYGLFRAFRIYQNYSKRT
jgi:FtsH-binding integral membrane protein